MKKSEIVRNFCLKSKKENWPLELIDKKVANYCRAKIASYESYADSEGQKRKIINFKNNKCDKDKSGEDCYEWRRLVFGGAIDYCGVENGSLAPD